MSFLKFKAQTDPLYVSVREIIDLNAIAEKKIKDAEFQEVAPEVKTSATPPSPRKTFLSGLGKLVSGQN